MNYLILVFAGGTDNPDSADGYFYGDTLADVESEAHSWVEENITDGDEYFIQTYTLTKQQEASYILTIKDLSNSSISSVQAPEITI